MVAEMDQSWITPAKQVESQGGPSEGASEAAVSSALT
jgi:hypothetical protein